MSEDQPRLAFRPLVILCNIGAAIGIGWKYYNGYSGQVILWAGVITFVLLNGIFLGLWIALRKKGKV